MSLDTATRMEIEEYFEMKEKVLELQKLDPYLIEQGQQTYNPQLSEEEESRLLQEWERTCSWERFVLADQLSEARVYCIQTLENPPMDYSLESKMWDTIIHIRTNEIPKILNSLASIEVVGRCNKDEQHSWSLAVIARWAKLEPERIGTMNAEGLLWITQPQVTMELEAMMKASLTLNCENLTPYQALADMEIDLNLYLHNPHTPFWLRT